ncbi:MAG TPA: 16S rRNA (guanine(966)-N(2))-methyltransferase RsmD [Allosphingosinicella sp.]|uniref:16S rRNA (guanine(966)-N(2))-methyltransferase RsmD n=1 Tax=Allosphingosinicella sp. TaxID=2823234 RepID=UPI002EDA88A8
MRIIAGEWRGRPLAAPEGQGTRPTSDRAREGLFSMLQSRLGTFDGLHVADLFAGTGALGLEALSRGAAHCTFVEKERAALDVLKQNVARFGAESRTDIRAQAIEYVPPPARPCDMIFLDPPYAAGLAEMALARICNAAWVAPAGRVSIETSGERPNVPSGFAVEAERRFGKAYILLIRKKD